MRGEGRGGEWALLVFGPFRRPCVTYSYTLAIEVTRSRPDRGTHSESQRSKRGF